MLERTVAAAAVLYMLIQGNEEKLEKKISYYRRTNTSWILFMITTVILSTHYFK